MSRFVVVPSDPSPDVIRKALESLARSSAQDEFALIDQIRQQVPFRHIAITGLDVDGLKVGNNAFLVCDFPIDYMTEYYSGGYIGIDPLIALFRDGRDVCRDCDAFATEEARRQGYKMLDLLRRHGIRERTVLPVRNGIRLVGTLSLISDDPVTESQSRLLSQIAATLHALCARPALEVLNRELKLTHGELYCLDKASQGLTSGDIAAEDVYSVDTVNTYLKTAARKLGALNRTQAVVKAMQRGLIG